MEMQGLKNQISVLEAQIQSKDEEIGSLRDALNKANEEKQAAAVAVSKKKIAEVKSRPNIKQVQIALANAGYNPGPIDGKMGKQTRDAIKAFQKANNLDVDARAGKKTWELLRGYLYKKIK
jgi:peptidoglycan hydrolase-like protein with peptidoglycan-binding domain